jgi:hypothetical protein
MLAVILLLVFMTIISVVFLNKVDEITDPCLQDPAAEGCETAGDGAVDCVNEPWRDECAEPVDCEDDPDHVDCQVNCADDPDHADCQVNCADDPDHADCQNAQTHVDCTATPDDPSCLSPLEVLELSVAEVYNAEVEGVYADSFPQIYPEGYAPAVGGKCSKEGSSYIAQNVPSDQVAGYFGRCDNDENCSGMIVNGTEGSAFGYSVMKCKSHYIDNTVSPDANETLYVKKLWPHAFTLQGYTQYPEGVACKTALDFLRDAQDLSEVFSSESLQHLAEAGITSFSGLTDEEIHELLGSDISHANLYDIWLDIHNLVRIDSDPDFPRGGNGKEIVSSYDGGWENPHYEVSDVYKDANKTDMVAYAQHGRTLCNGLSEHLSLDTPFSTPTFLSSCAGFVVDPDSRSIQKCVLTEGFPSDKTQTPEFNPNRRTFMKLTNEFSTSQHTLSIYMTEALPRQHLPNQITLKRFNGEFVPVVMTGNNGWNGGGEMKYGDHSPFYGQISLERHHESPEKVWQQALYPEAYRANDNLGATLFLDPDEEVGYRRKTSSDLFADHFTEDCPWRTKLNGLLYQDEDNLVVNGTNCDAGWDLGTVWSGKTVCELTFSETLLTSQCYRLEIGIPDTSKLGIELDGVVIYEGSFPHGLTTVAFSTNELWLADFVPPLPQRTGTEYIPYEWDSGAGGPAPGNPLFQSPGVGDVLDIELGLGSGGIGMNDPDRLVMTPIGAGPQRELV